MYLERRNVALGLVVCLCLSCLRAGAQPEQEPLPVIDHDQRFVEALASDPAYFRGDLNDPLRPTRQEAIRSWEAFLEQEDLPAEYAFIANWRLAAFYTYSMVRSKAERPDYGKGEAYLDQAIKVVPPDLVSAETLNAWSLWGNSIRSLPLSQGLERQAASYRWLQELTPEQMLEAAENTNGHGSLIPNAIWWRPAMNFNARLKLLERTKVRIIQRHEEHMTDLIEGASPDELSSYVTLVNAIEDVAPTELAAKWKGILEKRLGDSEK